MRKDRRLFCVLKAKGQNLITRSYPKFIMENYLGRYLEKDETVDHIDKNPLNNDISNLQVLKRSEHASLDAIRRGDLRVKCHYCGKEFVINGIKQSQSNRKRTGYFCSKRCVGKYGKSIQIGNTKPTFVPKQTGVRYTLKETLYDSNPAEGTT